MEIHDAFMAKQRNMYTWVDRARAVDVVIIGMEYGQSSGYNRREEQTHLVRIWMTMQRIMSGLGGGLAEMPRKHQEKLNALRNSRLHLRKLSLRKILSSHHKVV
jgi:hypothetical protein